MKLWILAIVAQALSPTKNPTLLRDVVDIIDLDALMKIPSFSPDIVQRVLSASRKSLKEFKPLEKKEYRPLWVPLERLLTTVSSIGVYDDDLQKLISEKRLLQTLVEMDHDDYSDYKHAIGRFRRLLQKPGEVLMDSVEDLFTALTMKEEGELPKQSTSQNQLGSALLSMLKFDDVVNEATSEMNLLIGMGVDEPTTKFVNPDMDNLLMIRLIDFASRLPIVNTLAAKNQMKADLVSATIGEAKLAVGSLSGEVVDSLIPNVHVPGELKEKAKEKAMSEEGLKKQDDGPLDDKPVADPKDDHHQQVKSVAEAKDDLYDGDRPRDSSPDAFLSKPSLPSKRNNSSTLHDPVSIDADLASLEDAQQTVNDPPTDKQNQDKISLFFDEPIAIDDEYEFRTDDLEIDTSFTKELNALPSEVDSFVDSGEVVHPLVDLDNLKNTMIHLLDEPLTSGYYNKFQGSSLDVFESALKLLMVDRISVADLRKKKLMLLDYLADAKDEAVVQEVFGRLESDDDGHEDVSKSSLEFIQAVRARHEDLMEWTEVQDAVLPLDQFAKKLQEIMLGSFAMDYCNLYSC